jgi:hypothetical protein
MKLTHLLPESGDSHIALGGLVCPCGNTGIDHRWWWPVRAREGIGGRTVGYENETSYYEAFQCQECGRIIGNDSEVLRGPTRRELTSKVRQRGNIWLPLPEPEDPVIEESMGPGANFIITRATEIETVWGHLTVVGTALAKGADGEPLIVLVCRTHNQVPRYTVYVMDAEEEYDGSMVPKMDAEEGIGGRSSRGPTGRMWATGLWLDSQESADRFLADLTKHSYAFPKLGGLDARLLQ